MVVDFSEYELLRQKRIQRNRELLKHIGLYDPNSEGLGAVGSSCRRCLETEREETFRSDRKRSRLFRGPPPASAEHERFLRRSARLAETSIRKPDSKRLPINSAPEPRPGARSKAQALPAAASRKEPFRKNSCSVHSTKGLVCDVAGLDPYVGRAIPVPSRLGGQIKRSVIEAAASANIRPVFNRMSGICEWQNAIMLFVNLPANDKALKDAPQMFHTHQPNGIYANVFHESGRYIVWYAQSTQGPGNPTLQRLISVDEATPRLRTDILLFCRMPKPYDSSYLYFGRLVYVEHSERTHPIRFVFRLADHARLSRSSNATDGCQMAFNAAIRGEYARAWQLASSSLS